MSSDQPAHATDPPAQDPVLERDVLRGELALLEAENHRLRQALADTRRTRYRRTATALAVVGLVALAGALVFPIARTVLITLGATGVFAAILTVYLTPERFVAATVGERVYDAIAQTGDHLVDELGLTHHRVYVPVTHQGQPTARLFIPQHDPYDLPEEPDLENLLVVPDNERARGIACPPTGAGLVAELEAALPDLLPAHPEVLATQLADGLVEDFELAAAATPDLDPDENRLSVGIRDSVYGPVDRFDHPITSTIATGLAAGLNTPVTVNVTPATDPRADHLITYRWNHNSQRATSL